MRSVCELNKCTGCSACVDVCPKNAISIKDDLKTLNAIINENECIHCGMCEKVCQQMDTIEAKEPLFWFQGWNRDLKERSGSSSGGIGYALAKQFLMENGAVASCLFIDGEFRYSLIDSISDLERIKGSKYVKSDPSGIYKQVEETLVLGKSVLFIGLPCHVAGLRKFIRRDYDNLITIDLICHGSPSVNLLELFLKQYSFSLKDFNHVLFREKTSFRLQGTIEKEESSRTITFTEPSIRDKYTISFLKGLTYTQNCYECSFAKKARISDITIGDSWGSELDNENKHRGISLVLCQTTKGKALLDRSGLELCHVDLEKAVLFNHQLREAFPIPKERDLFFRYIENGYSFNRAVTKCFPKLCFKTDVKNMLFKVGLKNIKK